jgi:hypothetical protein
LRIATEAGGESECAVKFSGYTFVNDLSEENVGNYTQFVCSCQEEMSYGSLEEEATAGRSERGEASDPPLVVREDLPFHLMYVTLLA